MRFLIVLLTVLLVSCASPKTAPQAYYSDVYAPGTVVIEEDGFVSRAAVFDEDNGPIARKSAFARLLLEAKEAGYSGFSITEEKTSKVFGVTHTVSGKLFKTVPKSEGVYPIDAIKRLLRDLPLEEPKPVFQPAPKNAKKVAQVRKKPATKAKPKPVAQPAPAVTDDEPLVIMAPEDITGSIRKAGTAAPVATDPLVPGLGTDYEKGMSKPSALSNVPSGVVIRRKGE